MKSVSVGDTVEILNVVAGPSSDSSCLNSNSDPSALEKAEPSAPQGTEPRRKGWIKWIDCLGCWPYWKLLPRGYRLGMIGCGLLACVCLAAFWISIYFTGKPRVERERQARLEIEKLDAANPASMRASKEALDVGVSGILPRVVHSTMTLPDHFPRTTARNDLWATDY